MIVTGLPELAPLNPPAVIVPAEKLPLLSLATTALAVLLLVALLLIVYVAFSPLPETLKPTPLTLTLATVMCCLH